MNSISKDTNNSFQTMCWKTWNDIIIDLPAKNVKWCCKTQYTAEQTKELSFDLEILNQQGMDFFINHPILNQRKWDLTGGVKNMDCQLCWKNEENTGSSVRTRYNKQKYDLEWSLLNHPRKSRENHVSYNRDEFNFIEIQLTNKCNMACVYCWEGLSSRWQKEVGNKFKDTEYELFEKVIELLNGYYKDTLCHRETIIFSLLGGEPFFSNHMTDFYEKFLKNVHDVIPHNQKFKVVVTTNLNFNKKKLEQFKEIVRNTPSITWIMQISAEAIEKRSEYIRWGKNWDIFDSNLDEFYDFSNKQKNMVMGFGSAHNSLSLPYYIEFLKYIKEKEIKYNFKNNIMLHTNWVDTPEHLSIATLPEKYKENLDECINFFQNNFDDKIYNTSEYLEVLKQMKNIIGSNTNIETKERSFFSFKKLEDRRNISFSDVFPHFSELVKTDK